MLMDLYTFWYTIIMQSIGVNLVTDLLTVIMCVISITLVACFIDYIVDKLKGRRR